MLNKDILCVFDLDDTLYQERDYFASGMHAVSRLVQDLYGADVSLCLSEWSREGVDDLFGTLCDHLSLPHSVKDSFIWCYRLHSPKLCLKDDVLLVIDQLNSRTKGIVILTDGRSISQRLKLKELGLLHFPLYISEEYSSEKPELLRFELIQKELQAARYLYVGDNPSKDFWAPNMLGWQTVGIRSQGLNIHSQHNQSPDPTFRPDIWLDSLDQLLEYIDNL